jgi:hypothetical protein
MAAMICLTCNGAGKVRCPTCDGTGALSRSVTTVVPWPPRGWHPIETAPRDGTDILVWGRYCMDPCTVRWKHEEWEGSWDGMRVIDQSGDFGTTYQTITAPTHWMPLPEPPAP